MVKIKLVGCRAYSYNGVQFLQDEEVLVSADKAEYLSKRKDDVGRNYFEVLSTEKSAPARTSRANDGPPADYMTKTDTHGRRMYDDDGEKIKPKDRDAFMEDLAAQEMEQQRALDLDGAGNDEVSVSI